MKKIFAAFILVLAAVTPVFAASYNASGRVPTVGAQLLTKNGFSASNVKFTVVKGATDNSNFLSDGIVYVSQAKLKYAGNDNEVAAVVGNELGHIIAGHAAKGRIIDHFAGDTQNKVSNAIAKKDQDIADLASAAVVTFRSSKNEKEADLIATNLMVKANYNPLALIVVLTKQTGTYWDSVQGKPSNADRAMNTYNYVSYVYPAKVKAGYGCNEYRNFLTYANKIVKARNASPKLKKANEKLVKTQKTKIAKKIDNYKVRGGLSIWDAISGFAGS